MTLVGVSPETRSTNTPAGIWTGPRGPRPWPCDLGSGGWIRDPAAGAGGPFLETQEPSGQMFPVSNVLVKLLVNSTGRLFPGISWKLPFKVWNTVKVHFSVEWSRTATRSNRSTPAVAASSWAPHFPSRSSSFISDGTSNGGTSPELSPVSRPLKHFLFTTHVGLSQVRCLRTAEFLTAAATTSSSTRSTGTRCEGVGVEPSQWFCFNHHGAD